MKLSNIIIGLLATLCVYLFFKSKNDINKVEHQHENNLVALTEEVETVKNKLGETSYKVTTLTSENLDLLDEVAIKDSTVLRLQTLASKYEKELKNKGSITVFNDTLVLHDTIEVNNINDTLKFNYDNKWISLSGFIKENLSFDLSISNEYSVIVGYDNSGFLKRKKPFTLITNKNPYSEVKDIKSYAVKIPKQHWGFGFTAGYGVVSVDNQLMTGLGIMFGLQYKL